LHALGRFIPAAGRWFWYNPSTMLRPKMCGRAKRGVKTLTTLRQHHRLITQAIEALEAIADRAAMKRNRAKMRKIRKRGR
jgi:hypothetical protein